eukprot:gnl/TRDRNA2_/TRDRNA2_171736_c0_seq2.p1 gnl/TRDRNA2_/TRDRNA2_171736_c0~~gnl/TRDRNA2_/TRDRNA2_171736_c0_seq2.p1  ORF type:complete len:757 (+),score=140.71 gnl/TRDRNA2_/TRDRNA2_171736_c0_seq2:66-2336(+)
MSAYAAAYAPPTGVPGSRPTGMTGAPRTYAPTAGVSPSATTLKPGGSAPGAAPSPFGFSGGLRGSWPSVEQLVAAVPVRPFEFSLPVQKTNVGERANVSEQRGVVPKPFAVGEDADFFLLKGVLTDGEAAELMAAGSKILSKLVSVGKARELDPTDRWPVFSIDLVEKGVYSDEIAHVLRPIVQERLLPYVRQKYACPGAALATARFRRFLPEERRFLPPHHEHLSFASATIGLQDPQALTGGFFVQGSGRAFLDRKFVALGRGDVVMNQYDLHHGIEVQEGSGFFLQLFFKDSPAAIASDSAAWYAGPAEAGDPAAQYGLALSLARQKDWNNAKTWLEKACAQDYPEALCTHAEWVWEAPAGSGFQADTARTLQLFRRAAELGHGRSQSRLGGLLATGVKGRVQQDTWEGKRLLRLAFEQDDADAAFHLGQNLLQDGDRDGATKLLAACAKGHPRACFQVAEMYREGQYQFPKDVPKSLTYTKWSAHQGDPQAISNLGHLIINGLGVIRDDAKAVRLFRHAAKLGAPEGQLNYGLALLRGNGGVRVDYQEALAWAQKSAAQGHTLAHQQLPMFFNAAKNPNPPARSAPASMDELERLGLKELREFLRCNGIDFSDCVEKRDLVARAASHLPGTDEPWDAAPEFPLLLEPPKRRPQQNDSSSQPTGGADAKASPTVGMKGSYGDAVGGLGVGGKGHAAPAAAGPGGKGGVAASPYPSPAPAPAPAPAAAAPSAPAPPKSTAPPTSAPAAEAFEMVD